MPNLTGSRPVSTSAWGELRNLLKSASLQWLMILRAAPAEMIHTWIAKQLPEDAPKPILKRPFQWVKLITYTTIGVASVVGITVFYPYALPVLQNRNIWAAASIFAILLFCSGYMFNHIRGAPYMGSNGRGGVEYFAGGFQNQFGLESQIVGVMCMLSQHISRAKVVAKAHNRWRVVNFDHCTRSTCTQNQGSKGATGRSVDMGRHHLRHVQLSAERFSC